MKENKGLALISVIVIVLAAITAILVAVEAVVIVKDINEEKVTISENTGKVEDNDFALEDDEFVTEDIFNKWVGVYENENTTINIWRDNIDQLAVRITQMGVGEGTKISIGWFSITIEEDTDILTHEGEIFGETNSAVITYMDNGINIEASSSDVEDVLNKINGDYLRKEFESSGWDGVYTKGGTTIILSEVFEEELMITIEKGYSSFSESIDEYTKQKIDHEEFGEEIFIEKTENGIKVQASSTDEDGLLNEISGEYVKE